MEFRQAVKEDEQTLMELYEKYRYEYGYISLDRYIKRFYAGYKGYNAYVVEEDGVIIACLGTKVSGTTCFISSALCEKEYRNKGVLKVIAKASYTAALNAGVETLTYCMVKGLSFTDDAKRVSEGYIIEDAGDYQIYSLNRDDIAKVLEGLG